MSVTAQPGLWVPTGDLSASQRLRLEVQVNESLQAMLKEVDTAGPVSGAGWSVDAYRAALTRLRAEGRATHSEIIDVARQQGGHISREKVYELAGYEPEKRSLRGFTRPVRRICEALRVEGALAEDAPELLEADYDETVAGFQRAGGFTVPAQVVELEL